MGSIIEVFPRRPHGARPSMAARWRASSTADEGAVRVRATRLEDCAAIRGLQRMAGTGIAPLTIKQLESQRHAFPEGQAVATCDGEVIGAASTLVLRWDELALEQTWSTATGDGFFSTHDPAGRTLYSAQVVVDSTRRGFGAGRALHHWQRRLARKLNLRRLVAAAPLTGYREKKDRMTPETYSKRIIWGEIAEPGFAFLLSQGYQYCGVIHDYRPEDEDSCGHAALAVWLNPFYSPGAPPANIDRERRKCA